MAKAVGLIGTLKGKVGNTVFATLRGETIARVYQPTVTNPNTSRQQLSRAVFAQAGELSRSMLEGVQIGWAYNHPGRGFQQAVKVMVNKANGIINGTDPSGLTINYQRLVKAISKADIGTFSCGVPDFETENHVTFSVNIPDGTAYGPESSSTYVGLVAVIYQPDTGECVISKNAIHSGAETIDVTCPAHWSGMRVQVYAYVKRILPSGNSIDEQTDPWRTPSKCSGTLFVGTGDMA